MSEHFFISAMGCFCTLPHGCSWPKNVEVPKCETAASFMQKGKWVDKEELRACCCLERRQWRTHPVLKAREEPGWAPVEDNQDF